VFSEIRSQFVRLVSIKYVGSLTIIEKASLTQRFGCRFFVPWPVLEGS